MLRKDLNDELLGKMYHWIAGVLVRERRNEYRFNVLFELVNRQLKANGDSPITLDDLDREMKFTDQDIMETVASEFFDLPGGIDSLGLDPTPENDQP